MTKKKETKKRFLEHLIDEVKENISEGTKVLGDKSFEVIEIVKEKSGEVYKAGSHAVESVNEKVHDFTEKQKLQKELRGSIELREELILEFGELVFAEYTKNGTVYKRFLTQKKTSKIIEEIKILDSNIKSIDQKLSS